MARWCPPPPARTKKPAQALRPTFRHGVGYASSMDARLEDFVGLLRHNGLRVSPAEVADAARATVLIGLEQRDPFRAALRATLVKRGPTPPSSVLCSACTSPGWKTRQRG